MITKLYADFVDTDVVKIYDNTEFIYKEYVVMQPLQRSYSITEESIANMLQSGALNSLYDEAKVAELEDRTKRQMAEFENFRKRTEKEKSQMFETGAKSVIEKILPVIDNFERGLAAIEPDNKDSFYEF